MFNEKVYEDTGLKCPVTGSKLIYTGCEAPHVYDGDAFYEAEIDAKIRYSKNARSKYYNLIGTNRWFSMEDKLWVEYFEVRTADFPAMFPVGTDQSVVDELVKRRKAERDERIALYNKRVASGEIVPDPNMVRVFAKPIGIDKVTVCPMGPPLMNLQFFNASYK